MFYSSEVVDDVPGTPIVLKKVGVNRNNRLTVVLQWVYSPPQMKSVKLREDNYIWLTAVARANDRSITKQINRLIDFHPDRNAPLTEIIAKSKKK